MRNPAIISLTAAIGACSTPTSTSIPGGHEAHGEHAAHVGQHTHTHAFTDAAQWAKTFDDPARDAWQQPDAVLTAMELAPTMAVADVGAGTGYFAVRLARAVPEGSVVGADIEADMVRHLNERAQREHLDILRATVATSTSAGLDADSADRILIVNVWHHIDDRVAYARDLAKALRPGGRLFIVDFAATATRGPPPAMRLAPQTIVDELVSAGLTATLMDVSLPEQFIVEAHRSSAQGAR